MNKWLISLALSLGLLGAVQAQTPDLSGHWQSTATEPSGPVFAKRSFHFEKDRWSIVFHAYADAQASVPLFTLDVGGVFVVGGPSTKVTGAYEGIFPATHRQVVADSDAGVALFASMGCTLRKGVAQALLAEGCGFVPGLMQAMGEYDLVAIKDGKLFFGDRAGDLTKVRPDKLTPFALQRQ
jgi:hypothetical protein